MEGVDNKAFDAMMNEDQTTGNLYTESVYNTSANKEEQGTMDRKAHAFLKRMYKDDKDAGMFEKLNFEQYKQSMSSTFFSERVNYPTKEDPDYYEEIGVFFGDNYEGDFDQFRDSADKYVPAEK